MWCVRLNNRIRTIRSVIFLVFLLLLISGTAESGSIRNTTEKESTLPYTPYLFAYSSIQDYTESAYEQVFTSPLVRLGGGFGLRSEYIGIEILMRTGGIKEGVNVDDIYRDISFKTTELQARLYSPIRYKNFTFPAGFGIGLVSMVVDRGYPGIFDKFKGDGVYFGPYAAVEYKISPTASLGFEAEYNISESNFNGSEVWHNQHENRLEGQLTPATEASFWDTVGGLDDRSFSGGGFVFAFRVSLHMPKKD